MRALYITIVFCGQVVIFSAASNLFGAEPLEFDSAYVGMTVSEQIRADEVFPVTITMRNTGTKPWQGAEFRLRPVDRQNKALWGTDYILIAQGTVVRPGSEYVFRSHLKAPSAVGPAAFQWQVCKDGVNWFGQTTPARSIQVLARTVETKAPGDSVRTASGKSVLKFADFAYAGSFKPPKVVNGARGAFSECGIALRKTAEGRQHLLLNYTHPKQVLFEVDIPPLVKIENGNHAGLNTAEIKQVWGNLKIQSPGEDALSPNGGFAWNEETRTLLWTWYHGYKTGEAPPVLGATKLLENGQTSPVGHWRVGAPGGLYKSYWGGVIPLPRSFAEQYTGGKTIALGFGGYYSICASASRGPALGAISQPDSQQASVSVTPLLYHPHNSPALRDGNYFNANCGFWSEQPRDPEHGTWSYDDWCRAGVFVESPSAHAYVAFVRLGTGRLGYDFGTITSAGSAEYWYLYDPRDLGEAALGQKKPWEVRPASMMKVKYPLGRTVTGTCFDSKARLLYVCVSWAYPDGKESYPIVHAYQL